jgi:hypothetical protein
MKLRLHGDSIRLRLKPAEVAELARSGSVHAMTHLTADSYFLYRLSADAGIERPTATLTGRELCVAVPRAQAADWATTDRVAISAEQEWSEGQSLTILIEKDFECLDATKHQTGEVLYPHPLAR